MAKAIAKAIPSRTNKAGGGGKTPRAAAGNSAVDRASASNKTKAVASHSARKISAKADPAARKANAGRGEGRSEKRVKPELAETAAIAFRSATEGVRNALGAITGAAATITSAVSGRDSSKSGGVAAPASVFGDRAVVSHPHGGAVKARPLTGISAQLPASGGQGAIKQAPRTLAKPDGGSAHSDDGVESIAATESPMRAATESPPMEAAADGEARPSLPVPIASFTI